jgi:RNA polymerase sigma-70 factor (sigma-E family)
MRGGEDGFRDFVAAQSAGLLRTAWMLTGDRELAEDLLQTALARTWPHWSRVSQGGAPTAYVRTVMARTSASWWARRWLSEVPTGGLADLPTTGDPVVAADDRDLLVRALAQLSPRQRATVVLRYYQDLSEHEAAAALGCSVGTVKTQSSRGLARLRELTAADVQKVGDQR